MPAYKPIAFCSNFCAKATLPSVFVPSLSILALKAPSPALEASALPPININCTSPTGRFLLCSNINGTLMPFISTASTFASCAFILPPKHTHIRKIMLHFFIKIAPKSHTLYCAWLEILQYL